MAVMTIVTVYLDDFQEVIRWRGRWREFSVSRKCRALVQEW